MAKQLHEIENPMISPFKRYATAAVIPFGNYCGCGRKATYEVYDHAEPHCPECYEEAIECGVPVLVRRID